MNGRFDCRCYGAHIDCAAVEFVAPNDYSTHSFICCLHPDDNRRPFCLVAISVN